MIGIAPPAAPAAQPPAAQPPAAQPPAAQPPPRSAPSGRPTPDDDRHRAARRRRARRRPVAQPATPTDPPGPAEATGYPAPATATRRRSTARPRRAPCRTSRPTKKPCWALLGRASRRSIPDKPSCPQQRRGICPSPRGARRPSLIGLAALGQRGIGANPLPSARPLAPAVRSSRQEAPAKARHPCARSGVDGRRSWAVRGRGRGLAVLPRSRLDRSARHRTRRRQGAARAHLLGVRRRHRRAARCGQRHVRRAPREPALVAPAQGRRKPDDHHAGRAARQAKLRRYLGAHRLTACAATRAGSTRRRPSCACWSARVAGSTVTRRRQAGHAQRRRRRPLRRSTSAPRSRGSTPR